MCGSSRRRPTPPPPVSYYEIVSGAIFGSNPDNLFLFTAGSTSSFGPITPRQVGRSLRFTGSTELFASPAIGTSQTMTVNYTLLLNRVGN